MWEFIKEESKRFLYGFTRKYSRRLAAARVKAYDLDVMVAFLKAERTRNNELHRQTLFKHFELIESVRLARRAKPVGPPEDTKKSAAWSKVSIFGDKLCRADARLNPEKIANVSPSAHKSLVASRKRAFDKAKKEWEAAKEAFYVTYPEPVWRIKNVD